MTPISNGFLDASMVQKLSAISRIESVFDFLDKNLEGNFIKTAKSVTDFNNIPDPPKELVDSLIQKLNNANIKSNPESISSSLMMARSNEVVKEAKRKIENKEDVIKIVSKEIRSSHYQIDLSKDEIVRNGKNIIMVSCYGKEAYLGQYLVKRNFYFLPSQESRADRTYKEILDGMNLLKQNYYDDIIEISAISTAMRLILNKVYSDFYFEEDK